MMNATDDRVALHEAAEIAAELIGILGPYCTRIEIAGSIRRLKPRVKDIELVCIPAIEEVPDLFGENVSSGVNPFLYKVKHMIEVGSFTLRPDKNGQTACGERYQRVAYKGIGVDLFSVLPPAQWGMIFAIRTGPDTFSKRMMTSKICGGKTPTGHCVKDGRIFDNLENTPIATPEERDVFEFLGLPWIEPWDRV